MLKIIDKVLSAQSTVRLTLLLLVLLAALGAIDLITGYELSFSIFYVLPVAIAAWYLGQRSGFMFCIAAALAWFIVDYLSGHAYSNPFIQFWNAGVRLGLFCIIVYLLARLHKSLDVQVSLAQLDGLTGLLNARTFRQRCESIFDLAARHNRPLALGYLDLDGFKGINDSHGHSVGDEVLKAVASVFGRRLRTSDLSSRLGGDEFAILLPDTDDEGARMFFTALHESLVELAEDHHWPVGFSIGVAIFHTSAVNPDVALGFTDKLMYKVKQSGKNNILFETFSPQQQ